MKAAKLLEEKVPNDMARYHSRSCNYVALPKVMANAVPELYGVCYSPLPSRWQRNTLGSFKDSENVPSQVLNGRDILAVDIGLEGLPCPTRSHVNY